ncbi:MAG: hypothetical protein IPL53_14305 [Ignavibacteria bacterium]|nr:hypothetical protein [Ignavibacteria bacterium]
MKKIVLILFIIVFSNSKNNAQWIIQQTGNTSPVRDVEFINKNTGWACGNNRIYKTTNSGNNWFEQAHPDAFLIQQIFPVNENVVYAVGWWNFMKTTNGGDIWTAFFNGGTGQGLPVLEGLYFLNENTGWLVGNVVSMKTTNGGESFVDSMRVEAIAQDVYFKDEMNGIMCGEVAGFYKTSDGGKKWIPIVVIPDGPQYDFIRLAVVNVSLVWVGSKPVYRSTDFGSTWDSIGLIPIPIPNTIMYCIEFSSERIGFVGGESGLMYKTTDGGYNWSPQNSGSSTSYIRSIYMYNDSIAWASRGNGTIMHTITGGMVSANQISTQVPETSELQQNLSSPQSHSLSAFQ